MTPEEVAELLVGTVFGPVRFVASTGSTNADLLVAARAGAAEGAVLVADHQTAGRGRRGRSWLAPPGSALLASVLLRRRFPPRRSALLSLATALAVRDACASYGAVVRLKWPNDVVSGAEPAGATGGSEPAGFPTGGGSEAVGFPNETKLAGVLAQFDDDGSAPAVVVGFGVNLRSHDGLAATVAQAHREDAAAARADAPAPPSPVTLERLVGAPVDRNSLLVSVLLRLDAWYRRLHDPRGAADLRVELERHSATLGKRVHVQTPGGAVVGRAAGLTVDGHLVVTTSEGSVTVTAGDCHHLRPTD